jgi:DNA-binding transcriptional ArsR family regulator
MANDNSDTNEPRSIQPRVNSIEGVIDLGLYQRTGSSTRSGSTAFDVRQYLPRGVTIELVERGGSLIILHAMLEFACKALQKKTEILCFLCALRFSAGFHRHTCKLSSGFIARWTGLHPANVRKALSRLKEMGLLQVLVPGTATTATVFEVPMVRGYLDWRKAKESEVESGQLQGLGRSNSDTTVGSTPKKKKPKENSNSLSETLPHSVKQYIAEIRPVQQRASETHFLNELLLVYPIDDISEALDYVQRHGTIDTGERVHSAMKYLSFTAEEVIAAISKAKARIAREEDVRRQLEVSRTEAEDRIANEAKILTQALTAFSKELTSEEQRHYINQFALSAYGTNGMRPPENVTHKLAAQHWFKRERVQ